MRSGPQAGLAGRTLGPFFLFAGAMHFVRPREYAAIMPPYVPHPREAVVVSGLAEMAGGAAQLAGAPRPVTRWWLIALLVAVFPANVHMALNPDQVRGLRIPRWLLWARLPLQLGFIAWAWRGTR